MIEINLLPGPKKRKKAAGVGFQMPDFSALAAKVKDPLLLAAVGGWIAAIVVIGLIFTMESGKLASLEEERRRVEAEARRFQALISQKRREERLRDSLILELDAIRAIDADRYVWPHILEEVTKAVPDYTWLQSVGMLSSGPAEPADTTGTPPLRILIDGRTSDMGGYTRFLRNLGNSPWLTNVVAGATRTVTENDKPIVAFTVTATFRRADSAFVRTVPVLESIR